MYDIIIYEYWTMISANMIRKTRFGRHDLDRYGLSRYEFNEHGYNGYESSIYPSGRDISWCCI